MIKMDEDKFHVSFFYILYMWIKRVIFSVILDLSKNLQAIIYKTQLRILKKQRNIEHKYEYFKK